MSYQCDVCGKIVPQKEIKTIIAYGLDTDACAECRGEEVEHDQREFEAVCL